MEAMSPSSRVEISTELSTADHLKLESETICADQIGLQDDQGASRGPPRDWPTMCYTSLASFAQSEVGGVKHIHEYN